MRAVLTMLLLVMLISVPITISAAEVAVVLPPPSVDNPKAQGPTQIAVVAGGCFWGVQGVYQRVRGVQRVLAGVATLAAQRDG